MMHLELILALALIIALNEMREWRFGRRMRKLETQIKAVRRSQDSLRSILARQAEIHAKEAEHIAKLTGDCATAASAASRIGSQLDTFMATVDAYGIRLNYKDPNAGNADYVGGF